MDDRAGETVAGSNDTSKALAMLDAFARIGTTAFDVTLTNLDGEKTLFQPKRSLDELRRTIAKRLEAAASLKQNTIIRPRSTTATLIQLDDLNRAQVGQIAPHAFLVICTSPGNHQAWVAVMDAPKEKDAARDFARRLRKGAGADPTATGATRIAGSLNFKTKYAPAFPCVDITHTNAGKMTSCAELGVWGFMAAPDPQPPASVPQIKPPGPVFNRKWPDYQHALRGAPLKRDGSGPDRSLADFMFCKWAAERGWSIEDTAAKLAEVSEKAQEGIRLKNDKGYPLLTARNANAAVERERSRRQSLKSTAHPRQ
jgi:RepB DNA-primase from phage plasmid